MKIIYLHKNIYKYLRKYANIYYLVMLCVVGCATSVPNHPVKTDGANNQSYIK